MYNRKKAVEDYPHEQTKIWSCSKEGCNGWMRDNFAFEYMPTCPICHSAMVSSLKLLPNVENSNIDLKVHKKGVRIINVK